ncbi:Putative alpha/beta hydrolase-1, protein phosphatase methylesterase [Septoria linicola]|uniref:Protein phosphatase methylesterase 1 n=1 Tax=Septoria linicola TaxID=215465 RepID=A0A9Q9ASW1_9PEZI|nr:putative alpha/beta hydrolase-1, protein phosphatase methylesterase [Septoria linicola]USW54515.1 Putative alpha/beta hydrolase-1, protein phosphatase methylesterase [Septoria linicola]
MSDLFRQKLSSTNQSTQPLQPPARPRPSPIATPAIGSISLSDDSASDSSASSTASVATVRPSSREQAAPPTHWSQYFEQELYLDHKTTTQQCRYHAYLTPPTDHKKGPLLICHHGAGASALSFANFAQELRKNLPAAGVLSLSARGHGSNVIDISTGTEMHDFSLSALVEDAITIINLAATQQGWSMLPPTILLGHSLGGAIVTTIANEHFQAFGSNLIGYGVLDVVEGSAIEALSHMTTYIASRPSTFNNVEEATAWHIRSRTIRDQHSAEASVPSLLIPSPSGNGKLVWRTNLSATQPWWEEWFKGMSAKFLTGRGAKLLILAGTDRLDKELMIGQMQGKFQLVVIPEAGHFVQEDVPEKTANLLVEFFKRNDRSAMVLPPKVSDLLAQGKKV